MTAKGGQPRVALQAAYDASSITPADGADLPDGPTIAIYVGGTGDLKVDMLGGTAVTFKAVPVGTVLNIRATRVYATGTTATLLLALYA